ncbi:hypothetical protein FE391_34460 [Nonomuraea sp. KC401]|uniref:Uncharacterized protein n=1 Tax=Nonomuraea longispora TaxID=1848320 RepID=A0A4R4MW92_9ACTN|nr:MULTISPECIES: hypothetical protein [Nonomuraea]NBE98743.1 hypothetical protein [Nonomuraea sp. K271]TDC00448.1 hypothetical protein E1267_34700 [Nonomuraea longispora]TLF59709.1 hypothetical protein FE391_34460 [Nonomuraea sp. KC401]
MGDDDFEHLERLVSELGAHGLLARVVQNQNGRRFVRVINPNATSLSENVTCRPATVSDMPDWWYCWSWGERMHTADDPAGAATKVARVLAAVVE